MQKMPPAIFTGTVFGLLQSFGLVQSRFKEIRCELIMPPRPLRPWAPNWTYIVYHKINVYRQCGAQNPGTYEISFGNS